MFITYKKRGLSLDKKKWKLNKWMNITVTRRIVQTLFLLFILYGGLLGVTKIFGEKIPELSEEDILAAEANENLQKDPRLDLYLPIRSCKNTDKDAGVFKGCGMYMMTNILQEQSILPYAIPLLLVVLFSVLLGRTWCGWACPIGFLQELADYVRGKFRLNYIKLSRKTNKIIRKIRFGWLATIFLVSFAVALPIFGSMRKELHNVNCLTCPTRYALQLFPKFDLTFMSFSSPLYSLGSLILIFFLGMLIMSFFIRRFWCRLCPNGTFLALFNKGCFTTKEKDLQKCTKCGICYQICPMDNEDVYTKKSKKVVNSKNCVMCFECVHKCPENDCLQVKIFGKTVARSKYK